MVNELKLLNQQNHNHVAKITELESTVSSLHSSLQIEKRAHHEVRDSLQRMELVEQELTLSHERILNLSHELDTALIDLDRAKSVEQSNVVQIEHLNQQLQHLSTTMQAVQSELEVVRANAAMQKEDEMSEETDDKNALDHMRAELNQALEELQEIQHDATRSATELVKSHSLLGELQHELDQVKSNLNQTDAESNLLKVEMISLRQECLQLKQALLSKQDEVNELSDELHLTQEALKQKQQLLVKTREELKSLQNGRIDHDDNLQRAKEDLIRKQFDLRDAYIQFRALQDEIDELNSQMVHQRQQHSL
jgi:chromosome segregation ATPase